MTRFISCSAVIDTALIISLYDGRHQYTSALWSLRSWGTRRTPSVERMTREVPELYWRAPDVVSPIRASQTTSVRAAFERLLWVTVKPRKAFDEVRGIVSDRGTFAVFRIYPQPGFNGEALVDEESLIFIAPDQFAV